MPRTPDPQVIETLRRARELVDNGWTTGQMWRNAAGLPIDIFDCPDDVEEVATCCAMGSIYMAAIELHHKSSDASVWLAHMLDPTQLPDPEATDDPDLVQTAEDIIIDWNDSAAWNFKNSVASETDALAQVLAAFDRAIA